MQSLWPTYHPVHRGLLHEMTALPVAAGHLQHLWSGTCRPTVVSAKIQHMLYFLGFYFCLTKTTSCSASPYWCNSSSPKEYIPWRSLRQRIDIKGRKSLACVLAGACPVFGGSHHGMGYFFHIGRNWRHRLFPLPANQLGVFSARPTKRCEPWGILLCSIFSWA